MSSTARTLPLSGRTAPVSGAQTPDAAKKHALIGVLFIVAMALPANLDLGGIRFTAYRLWLVLAFLPLFFAWVSGKYGKVGAPDILFLLAGLWGAMTLIVAGYGNTLEASGIFFLELFGAYLLGRAAVRSGQDHRRVLRTLFWILAFFLPFAMIEIRTGTSVPLQFLSKFLSVHAQAWNEPRMGMERAQVIFEHPIHYGVFAASAFGFCLYSLSSGRGWMFAVLAVSVSLLSTLFSVSTGPYMMLGFQLGLVLYDQITRNLPNRWRIFAIGSAIFYIILEIGTYRTPFHWIVNNLSFSTGSAYNRIRIFEWGLVNIRENPIFGIGLGDWKRESFMSSSADNFWILITMRHGIPFLLLFSIATILIIRRVGRANITNKADLRLRAGYLISMGGLIIGGFTVHYWNVLFVYLMFLLGSGGWMFSAPPTEATREDDDPAPDPTGRRITRHSGRKLGRRAQISRQHR